MTKVPFTDLPLSKEVLKSIVEMGFEEATAIQAEAIPPILEGRDVIGQSRTGTGKTIAFAIPAVERIDTSNKAVQALILCPTRELCIQVAEEVSKLGKHKKGLRPLPIFGGQSYERQFQGLQRGAQIVIGTPGRLIDHLGKGTLKLEGVGMVVLDEADEMLDMGFQEDIDRILETVPEERQTVLFSATMAPGIRRLATRFLRDPLTVKSTPESLAVPAIEQMYMEVHGHMKLEALCRCLDFYSVKLGIVFCNTKNGVDELVGHLQARGYSAESLHGDHKQMLRDRIMKKFRTGQLEILVATDVASRGIDVKDIELVVNYDLPKDEEDYVHRIGRTGRAGKTGRALSFASGRDLFRLRGIERYAKVKVERKPVPSLQQIESMQHSALLDKVRETLSQNDLERVSPMIESLTGEDNTVTDVACALLKMLLPASVPGGEDVFAEEERQSKGKKKEKARAGGQIHAGDFPARKPFRGADADGDAARLFLNVGRENGVAPKDILGALAGETGLPGGTFGGIRILPTHTVVDVPADTMEHILKRLRNARIKGVRIKAREYVENPGFQRKRS